MIRGFYTSLAGIIASMNRQNIVADNIANVNTPGFKGSRSTQSDFGLTLASSLGGSTDCRSHTIRGYFSATMQPIG